MTTSIRPKPRSLTVLLPLAENTKTDWATHQFLSELREAFADLGVEYGELTCIGLDQAHARAELLSAWYQLDHTEDALLLDSDMASAVELVTQQLCVLAEPVLVCPYLQRNEGGHAHHLARWTIDTAGKPVAMVLREGRRMMPMPAAGLGFTRIRRAAVAQAWDFFTRRQEELDAILALHPELAPHTRRLFWSSHLPNHAALPVLGLFEHVVNEHVQDGPFRRRSEDISFFLRLGEAGLVPYALADACVWHHGKNEGSFMDALRDEETRLCSQRRRVHAQLPACPDDLLGLEAVLDGAYYVPGLSFASPPHVLDVGANVGAFAVWAAREWPGCSIDCYEPHPEHVAMLKENLGIHPDGMVAGVRGTDATVSIAEVAVVGVDPRAAPSAIVGPKGQAVAPSGPITVRLFDPAVGMNRGMRSLRPFAGGHAETFTEVRAILAADLPPCDVLKLDVEGCAREILEHYPHLRGCSAVLCEWDSSEEWLWMRGALRELGFEVHVDRAHGRPGPHREILFVRRGIIAPPELAANKEAEAAQ